MPPVSRVSDTGLGHDSFPPTPVTAGSGDVFAGGLAVCRVGDPLAPHGSPSPSPVHPRSASAGSGTVFTNGKPTVRIGDSINCGGLLASGLGTVIVGG